MRGTVVNSNVIRTSGEGVANRGMNFIEDVLWSDFNIHLHTNLGKTQSNLTPHFQFKARYRRALFAPHQQQKHLGTELDTDHVHPSKSVRYHYSNR